MRFSTSAFVFAAASVAVASPLAAQQGNGLALRGDYATAPGGPVTTPAPSVNACGVISTDQIAALSPLLQALGLAQTVDGVKQLVKHILQNVGGLILGPVGGLLHGVTNLVQGLIGVNIPLDGTVEALANLIGVQVPCILDTLLPLP
ncbi:hypothetical protein H4R19_002043 [Coemansia spiralis]|nr:hypothetical protein H4R19_002043 [Coemansia spiralis]